jgi:multimeric flavodoxin WrbA
MTLKALFLNCTLKYAPAESNTRALIDKVAGLMEDLGAETEILRMTDYDIRFGVSSDEGRGDQWPAVLERVLDCDILVLGSPIWFGVRSSVAQMVLERLDGTYALGEADTGRYPLYNKVAGVIVTGNEDGAHNVAAHTLFNLAHLGCTIPPNPDCYWVGDAGPGPSYLEAGGRDHLYTNRTARYMAHNLVAMAGMLRDKPLGTNLRQLDAEAAGASSEKHAGVDNGA